MFVLHQPGDLIKERYQILRPIGQGGMGKTYAAVDCNSEEKVAIKTLSLKQIPNWKSLELLEREAEVLAELNHPAIPNYIDHFTVDTPEDYCFYLVQELAPGNSLATLVQNGFQPTEKIVCDIAQQVLEILDYLHSHIPPILHRDIKPENLICTKTGKMYLVDFGAVQAICHQTIAANNSTFVGTFHYMPVEQMYGKAQPASDLYSLGASLVYLLTHRSPNELSQKNLKIDFRKAAISPISKKFAKWLDKMLEPDVQKRFSSAKVALKYLPKPVTKSKIVRHHQPKTIQAVTIFLVLTSIPLGNQLANHVAAWWHSQNSETSNDYQLFAEEKDSYQRGKDLAEQEKYTQAIEAFTQAIESNINPYQSYGYRGFLYQLLGENRKAIADYDKAIALNPRDSSPYYNQGIAYAELQEYRQAIDSYTRSIEVNAGWNKQSVDSAYFNRGLVYKNLGEYKNALADFSAAIRLDKNRPRAYFNRGVIYEKMGDINTARSNFEQAAQLYQKLGSEKWYRKSLERVEKLR
jgi:serine/threonine protein kinase